MKCIDLFYNLSCGIFLDDNKYSVYDILTSYDVACSVIMLLRCAALRCVALRCVVLRCAVL